MLGRYRESLRVFFPALMRWWWFLVPGVVAGVDYVGHLSGDFLPKGYEPPVSGDAGVVLLLAGGLVLAAFFAFHDQLLEKEALTKQLDERGAKRAALGELDQWINSGNRLRMELFAIESPQEEGGQAQKDAEEAANSWAVGAAAVISQHWPERRAAFWSDTGVRPLLAYSRKPQWFNQSICWIDARLARLIDLQRENGVPARDQSSSSPATSSQAQT